MALLFSSESDSAVRWKSACLSLRPDLDFRIWPEIGDKNDIDAALVWAPEPGLLADLANLKAIFSLGAGIDGLLADPTLPDVPLCRMVDPSLTRTMTDFVMATVLFRFRELDRYSHDQRLGKWEFSVPRSPGECTIGIMGLGELGTDAALTLLQRGFDVCGWSRTARSLEGVATYAGKAGLEDFLSGLEILICLMPLTWETRHLLNRRTLNLLPRGAYVINLARGSLVVDEDLLEALDNGHLSGALLDVFETEPLPSDHRFWRHPGVTMTPHVASYCMPEQAAASVMANYDRLMKGEPLHNVVDRAKGY